MAIENDILIIDDKIPNLKLLIKIFEREGFRVRLAEKAKTGIDSALTTPPGLIILGVSIPDMDGFELCRRLKQEERTRDVPVIFVSELQDTESRIQGFKTGGVDFISHPFEESELLARVKTHIELHRLNENLRQLLDKNISELKKSRASFARKVKALEKSEKRFELSIAGSSAGIWDWDILSGKVFYSERFKQFLGYTSEEIQDSLDEFWSRLHPDDCESVQLALDRHLKDRVPFRIDYRLQCKSGEYRWYYARGQAQYDETGRPTRMSGSIIDITKRKKTEKKLLMSEKRYRRLIEQFPLGIEILSPEGRICQVNDAWKRLWGLSQEDAEIIMKDYNMLDDMQARDIGLAHLVKMAFNGEEVVLPTVQYDGAVTANEAGIRDPEKVSAPWVQCHLHSIRNESGEIEHVVNTYVDMSDKKQAEMKLREALESVETLKTQLEEESAYLQEEIKLEHNFENIIGQSAALKYVLNRVEQVAAGDTPVLIMGESGTGKELVARAIHKLSRCSKRPLIKVNCAALPGELIESELFGREKGAFTGATTAQAGRFELAKGSTLFLDEIGELPFELQAKLLRVLDSGEFERLGSTRTIHSDARIIAATNRILEKEVENGRFRKDLWFRLKVFPLTLPPLRERPEDIPLLVRWFVEYFSRKMNKPTLKVSNHTMKALQQYHWPGNVRELQSAVESALITSQGDKLIFDFPQTLGRIPGNFKTLEKMERDYILRVLESKNWKIGGPNSASDTLGVHVNTLRGRMKKLGIKKPRPQ